MSERHPLRYMCYQLIYFFVQQSSSTPVKTEPGTEGCETSSTDTSTTPAGSSQGTTEENSNNMVRKYGLIPAYPLLRLLVEITMNPLPNS